MVFSGRMYRRSFVLGVLLAPLCLWLSSAATIAFAAEDGEHLVSTFRPDAATWERIEVPDRPGTRLWKSRENEREQYRVEILEDSAQNAREARLSLDGQGKASCRDFDTTTLREARVNGYPSLLWRTDCVRENGETTTLLQLAVRGRKSLYLVMKAWAAPPASADLERWVERFERHLVCDPRAAGQVCPPGFERVD